MTQEPEQPAKAETRAALDAIFEADEEGLLDVPEKAVKLTAADRLQRSFLEIIEFVREHGREPSPTTREIGERKLGARLDGIRMNPEKVDALRNLDEFDLLNEPEPPASLDDLLSDDGIDLLEDPTGLLDTTALPKRAARIQPEDVAQRVKSTDFELFEPLFKQKHAELRNGTVKLVPFFGQQTIEPGAFFVLNGIMLFIADIGDEQAVAGKRTRYKRRTRTIYENGTESNLYSRSLAGQLYENEGFAVVPAAHETLLADDEATGWVYVLRSLSDDAAISARTDLFKIGFSTTPVAQRVVNAERESTYLMAPVDVVAEYRTYNMKTSALEHLLHRVFADVRLQVNQVGIDGRKYDATEWFEVPLPIINQAINLITTGEIVDFVYDAGLQKLIPKPS